MKHLGKVGVMMVSLMVLPGQAESIKVDMHPGLWENNMTWEGDGLKAIQAQQTEEMKAAMAEMKAQFANMPPEQRKQMEALMAQSGMQMNENGVSFNDDQVQISTSGSNVKSCITQAEIDRGEFPDNAEGCKSTMQKIGDNRFKATFVCSGDGQSSGESEVTFQSPKQYSGTGKMTTQLEGKTHQMNFKLEGRWLGSDCGAVKPAEQ